MLALPLSILYLEITEKMNQGTNLLHCESSSSSGNIDDWVKLNSEPPV